MTSSRRRPTPITAPVRVDVDELLTTAEVAAWLRRSPDRVRQWRFEGRGPAFIRDGDTSSIWYRRSAVEAWLAAGEVAHHDG